MAHSDMQIFDEYVYTTFTETIDQQVMLFNEATRGAIILTSESNQGDYKYQAFYKAFTTQARRRDVYNKSAVTAQDLSQESLVSVKVGLGHGPFAFDVSQFSYVQRNLEEAAIAIGEQVAAATMQDKLNTAVGAARAAIVNQGSLDYDGTSGTLDIGDLNKGAALFGDKAQDILCWVMHSKAYFDLTDAAITNTNQLFEFGTINVTTDGFGRPLVVSDIPELVISGTPDNYHTLGLVSSGIVVEDNGDFQSNTQTNNGQSNIERTWQAESTYQIQLKGYSWDVAAGGASPIDSEIFTGTNWDQVATYDKDTAGVVVRTQ